MDPKDNFANSAQTYCWFHGVVEDVADPLEMGRVRVRCVGYHTDDLSAIPTASLPWAIVTLPVNSPSMAGAGISGTGILRGSWVIGFFRDGQSAQDPLIIGTVPSQSYKTDNSKGFSDPSGVNPKTEGTDTPLAATSRYKESGAYMLKAAAPTISGQPSPDSRIRPIYPLNQVLTTNSGHTVEYDDTPGYERISITHRSGSFIEFDAAGNMHMFTAGNVYHKVAGNYTLSATRIDLNP